MLKDLLNRVAGAMAAKASDPPGVLVPRALEHHQAGRLAEADALYRQALAQDPGNVDALHFAGVIAFQQGRHSLALELIGNSLARNNANPPAHSNLGNVLNAMGRVDEAAASYEKAIALQPDYVDAHLNLGSMLAKAGRGDAAAAAYERAVAAAPQSAQLHFHLAAVQVERLRPQEAADGFRRALALKPDYPEASAGLATALLALARPREADELYRKALERKPDLPQARLGRALAKMMQGDYAEGLPMFEARLEESGAAYAGPRGRLHELREVPRWSGDAGARRRLFAWADQGFGDIIMVLRYLPLLKARGFAQVAVQCEAALARIVRSMPGVDEVVLTGDRLPLERIDCHLPMSSLPLAFGTRIETIPRGIPYIAVPPSMKSHWAARVAAADPVRVGLVWAGRRDFPKDALRSIRLERFEPLRSATGATFVSLQKGDAAAERARLEWQIHDWMEECYDLLDTAALIEQLDLVIGVDTGIVHLAAALGRPTWLLNRFESEWRWMLDREDCAWYPTLKIFRQPELAAWDAVLSRVSDELKAFVAARAASGARAIS